MEHSFSCRSNAKFLGGKTEHLKSQSCFSAGRNVPNGNRVKLVWYHFQAFAPFYNFLLRELICANGRHDCGRKLTVLNFSYHSPKPTDFLNIIMSTIIMLLITFLHRFVFYWFVSLCSWYTSHIGYCTYSLVLINHKQKSLC